VCAVLSKAQVISWFVLTHLLAGRQTARELDNLNYVPLQSAGICIADVLR
jgi:hypothetical protein